MIQAVKLAADELCDWPDGLAKIVEHAVTDAEPDNTDEISEVIEKTIIAEGELEVARCYMLYRARKQLFFGQPDPTILQDYITHAKYTRAGESWEECVDRVCQMHVRKFPEYGAQIIDAFGYVKRKEVMPSMRSLQFGGPAIEANAARMYNCSFTNVDRLNVFKDIFWLLLSGCGVGYSVERVDLPEFPELTDRVDHFQVEDTIEGWAQAVDFLVTSAARGIYAEFSYDVIRPKGAELTTSGGKAPGHRPLKEAIEAIRPLLRGRLSPFTVHRIICLLAQGVVSGGIRRSSLICIFSPDDHEMMECKAKDKWWEEMPELAMANNSVNTASPTREMFSKMEKYGEPGIVDLEPGWGTNPCGEIGLHPEPGTVAFCNLTEIVGQPNKDKVWAATFIGTLQATWIPEFVQVSDKYLLGVSVTGICDEDIEWSGWRDQVREFNQQWAPKLGIEPTDRLTCVKPSGTASLLVGRSAGIHPGHAKRAIRRIIAQPSERVAQEFRAANPWAVEVMPDGNWSLMFPVQYDGMVRDDLGALDQMELVRRVFDEWVTSPHNVSCTVTVREHEWDEVFRWVKENGSRGMAFLPWTVEYPYSPWSVNEAVWRDLVGKMVKVNYEGGVEDFGAACEGGSCDLL